MPIGPRDGLVGTQERRPATTAALNDIRPVGNTPLYRAIVEAKPLPNDFIDILETALTC